MKKVILLAFALLFLVTANASAEVKIKSLAKKKWTLVESDNFRVITDLSPKKARLTTEQLEKFRAFAALWLNKKVDQNVSKMVLFITDRSSTWASMGLNKDWVSLYASRTGVDTQMFVNVKGFFGRSFRNANSGRAVVLNTVAQELFNNVGIGAEYPKWFKTGFAYYLATYTEPGKKIMLGSLEAYNNRLYSLMNQAGGVIRFDSEELFSRKKSIQLGPDKSRNQWLRESNRFYMQSFLMIHYLYSDNKLRGQMFDYLRVVVSGVSAADAMEQAFSKSFDELDKDLRKYAAGSRLSARVMLKTQVEELMTLPSSYEVSRIDDAQFFEFFAKAVLELGETGLSNQDKQSFLKAYQQRYLSVSNSTPRL